MCVEWREVERLERRSAKGGGRQVDGSSDERWSRLQSCDGKAASRWLRRGGWSMEVGGGQGAEGGARGTIDDSVAVARSRGGRAAAAGSRGVVEQSSSLFSGKKSTGDFAHLTVAAPLPHISPQPEESLEGGLQLVKMCRNEKRKSKSVYYSYQKLAEIACSLGNQQASVHRIAELSPSPRFQPESHPTSSLELQERFDSTFYPKRRLLRDLWGASPASRSTGYARGCRILSPPSSATVREDEFG